ncbi:MAG: DUF4340 domain-containing protein [Deltaproteobacteria bacterium]|nr:DUF4340 domain-containing protein [Deltaproteobacteria bacterium]
MKTNKIFKTVLPFIILVVLSGGIYFLWPKDIKPPTLNDKNSSDGDYPLTAADLKDVDKLEVKNIHGNFRLEKINGTWFLTSPIKSVASQRRLNAMLLKLSGIRYSMMISDSPKTFRTYKVDDKNALRLKIFSKGKMKKTIYIGKSRKFSLIRQKSSNSVWQLKGAIRQVFVLDSIGWIEPRVAEGKYKDVKTFSIFRNEKQLYEFSRGPKGDWKVLKGDVPEDFTSDNIRHGVMDFLNLKIQRINNDVNGKEKYFKSGRVKAVLTMNSGKTFQFISGDTIGQYINIEIPEVTWLGEIFARNVRNTLILDKYDLMNGVMWQGNKDDINEISGSCRGFEFKMSRKDPKSGFKYVKGNISFSPSPAKMKSYTKNLAAKGFHVEKIIEHNDDIYSNSGLSPESDFIEIKKFNGERTRCQFGKEIQGDMKGYFWTWTQCEGKEKLLFKIEREVLYRICPDKKSISADFVDPETIPKMKLDKGAVPGKIRKPFPDIKVKFGKKTGY